MLVFKNVASETTSMTQQLTIFGKTFADIKKDLHNGLGIKSFSSVVTSKDIENLRKFNTQINNGVKYKTAFDENLSSSSIIVKRQANELIGLNKQLKALQTQYSQGKIEQSEYITQVQATQERITALTTQTGTLTLKQRLLAGATKTVATAFNMLKMVAVTFAVSGIIALITEVVNKQKELAEQTKQTATEAKQTSVEISNLYTKYLELNQAVVDGTGSKEDLNSATDELLKALGLEGIAVDELTSKYGSLEKAISNVTIESLKSTHDDLVASVNVYKDELLKTGQSIWDGNQFKTANYKIEPNKFDTEIDKIISAFKDIDNLEIFKDVGLSKNDNVTNAVFNLLGDTSTVEGIKQNYETLMEMQDALVSKFGSQKAGELKIYQEINSRLNELKTAYENYTDEITALNQNAAKTAVLESLKGKELPKTQEEFKQFYNTLISDATTAGTEMRNQFVGSEDDIKNSIKSVLEGMSIFDEFTAEPIPVEVEVFPTVTANVSALKQSLNTVKEKIEDTFKNTNIFDEAIQSIQDGKAIDFSDVMSMVNLDSSLADKFVKTADGYTIAIKDLTQSRYEYIKSTKDSIQADIDSAKSSISTAEENINTYQKESELLTEAAKHNSDAANRKKELDNAIATERQNIEDANNVIAQNTLLLDECSGAADNFASTVDNVSKRVKLIATAMKDMNENGYISSSTYAELQEMGGNYTECLEVQNGKLVVNIKKLKELEAQEYKNIKAHKQALLDTYELINTSRKAAGLDTSFIDEQISNLQTEIAGYQTIIDEIDKAGIDSGDPATVKQFKKDNEEKKHLLEMERITEQEYYDWLDSESQRVYGNLADYQDELWKHEEEVYNWRQEQEQKLFDKKIDNLEKLADKALDNYKDGDGNELTVTASFDYAREQINKAIAETQARIDGIRNGTISGNIDDIETLIDDLDQLNDKLIDINKKEIESEKDYIGELKDDYSDMMDERIKAVEKLSDAVEKSYENEINAIDKKIKAIDKESDAEDRKRKILEAQKKVKEAEKELNKAGIKKYIVLTNNGWEAQADTTDIEEAQKNLDEAKQNLEDALKDEQKAILEDQKDILEEQRDNAKEYYSTQKEALETQKTYQEDVCNTLSDILDKIGGDTKQTESNKALIDKLTKSGDVNAVISKLSEAEKQKALESGLITETDSGFELNYSALDKMTNSLNTAFTDNTKAINDLAVTVSENNDIHKTENNAEQSTDTVTAGGFNLVADPKTGKLTKKQVMVNGEVVEGLGHKVNATSKEEWQEHNNSEKTSKGSFAGYDTFIDFMRAVSAGKVDISPLTNAFNSDYNPIVDKMNKSMSDTINNVSNSNVNNNVNNKPAFNCTINIEGSADEKTVEKFRSVCENEINGYFQYLNNTMNSAFVKSRYSK